MKNRYVLNFFKFCFLLKNRLLDFVEILIAITLILLVLIILYIFEKPQGFIHDQFPGLFLDLLFFGVLIVFFSKLAERRRNIKRWNEEIDDYRHWDEKEALYRILGIIRRLNKQRYYKINLDFCFLEKALLDSAKLIGASLAGANLREAHLRSASLEFANLDSANFSKADLSYANLSNTIISDASFCSARMYNANLQNALARRSQEVNFSSASLDYANLFQARLSEAFFINSSLLGAIFDRSYLWDCVFRNAIMRKTTFAKATLIGVNFADADLSEACFYETIMETYHEELSHGGFIHLVTKFTNARLDKVDFRSANLLGVVFTNANMQLSDLRGVTNLTIDQLRDVKTLFGAKLDPELEIVIREKLPSLLDKPIT